VASLVKSIIFKEEVIPIHKFFQKIEEKTLSVSVRPEKDITISFVKNKNFQQSNTK
jgi:hypothetical protein